MISSGSGLAAATVACAAVLVSGCGARTEPRVDASGAGGSPGAGGAATSSSASSGGGGLVDCPIDSFAGDQSGGIRLELDATHAYWTTLDGLVQRGSLETGEVDDLVQLASATSAIALSGPWVYAADEIQILRVPKEGGRFESLAPGVFIAMDLVASGETVWLLDRGSGILAGSVQAFTPETGLVTILENIGLPRALAADDARLYLVAESALVDGRFVQGPLLALSKDGGDVAVLASRLDEAFGVEVTDDLVVWGTSVDPRFGIDTRLFSLAKDGGSPIEIAALGTDGLGVAMAIDDTFAYATMAVFDQPDGPTTSRLVRAPLSGGAQEVLLDVTGRIVTEPAATPTHVGVSIQHDLPPADDPAFANVRVLCKP